MLGFILPRTSLTLDEGSEHGPEEKAEGEQEEDPLDHGHGPGHHEKSGITD